MNLRPDLANAQFIVQPFLTSLVAPEMETATMNGLFLAQQCQPAVSGVQTNRADGTEATVTQVVFDDFAFTCEEKINHNVVDERYIGFAGSLEKAQLQIARAGQTAISLAVEADTAKGILDSSNITTVDATTAGLSSLVLAIDTAVQALRQEPGVQEVALVASDYVWSNLILADTGVKARLANPSTVVYNATADFKNQKMSVFAGEFSLDKVLLGGNAAWYTAVTNKNYCAIVALPKSGMNPMEQIQLGTTVVYTYPNIGKVAVGTYYSDARHAEVVDCWSRTDYVELNPELGRKIKIS